MAIETGPLLVSAHIAFRSQHGGFGAVSEHATTTDDDGWGDRWDV